MQLPFAETRQTVLFVCSMGFAVGAAVVCVRFDRNQCQKGGMQCMFGRGTGCDQMDVREGELMMSLLSLSLFASVCSMLEPTHVMFVRLHVVVAGSKCQTRRFLFRAGGSHCVFVACPAHCPNTQPPPLSCCQSLSRERMCCVWASPPFQTLTRVGN